MGRRRRDCDSIGIDVGGSISPRRIDVEPELVHLGPARSRPGCCSRRRVAGACPIHCRPEGASNCGPTSWACRCLYLPSTLELDLALWYDLQQRHQLGIHEAQHCSLWWSYEYAAAFWKGFHCTLLALGATHQSGLISSEDPEE